MDAKTKRLVTMGVVCATCIVYGFVGKTIFDILYTIAYVLLLGLAALSAYCYIKDENLVPFLNEKWLWLTLKVKDLRKKKTEPEVVETSDSEN